jgi:hypothetical protein
VTYSTIVDWGAQIGGFLQQRSFWAKVAETDNPSP